MQLLEKFDMDEVADDPLEKINSYIENEAIKESYVISPERYGTVDDYMEIILQYSLLALFGMSFPMSLFIAFLWNVLELQTDKMKLLNYMQRPLPLGERTIGVWNGILELLSYLSLMSNTGLMSFMSTRILDSSSSLGSPIAYFLILLIVNFFFRFMENSLFGEISYQVKGLMKRHEYILKSTIDKFRGKSQKEDKDDDDDKKQINSSFPIYKQFGCVLLNDEQENQFYEDVSSDDDIEDHYKYSPQEIDHFKLVFGKRKKLTAKQLFDDKLPEVINPSSYSPHLAHEAQSNEEVRLGLEVQDHAEGRPHPKAKHRQVLRKNTQVPQKYRTAHQP